MTQALPHICRELQLIEIRINCSSAFDFSAEPQNHQLVFLSTNQVCRSILSPSNPHPVEPAAATRTSTSTRLCGVMSGPDTHHPDQEKVKEAIAYADQVTTTKLRDATHAAAEGVARSASQLVDGVVAAASAAGDAAKNATQVVMDAAAPSLAQDPDVGTANKGASPDSNKEVMVEVGDTVEVVRRGDLEPGRPATDQVLQQHQEQVPPTTDIGDGIHTPESTVSVMTGAGHPVLPFTVVEHGARGPQPTIATPVEPTAGSARETLKGQPASAPVQATNQVAVGDDVATANSVATMTQASGNVVNSVKGAVSGLLGSATNAPAPSPAGVSDDTDIREVGNFQALHDRIHQEAKAAAAGCDTKESSSSAVDAVKSRASEAADAVKSGANDAVNKGKECMDSAKASADDVMAKANDSAGDVKDRADDVITKAKDSVGQATKQAKQSSQEAGDRLAGAVGGNTTATTGGGLLGGLSQLVSDVATKVNIASNSEEVLAGGVVPDEGQGPGAAAGGGSAEPAVGKEVSKPDNQGSPIPPDVLHQSTSTPVDQEHSSLLTSLKNTLLGDTISPQSGNSARSKADELQAEQAGAPDVPAAATKPSHGGRDGVGETLKQGWEDLKRGGAKAPWSTTQGESGAPQDVTSNVGRSRHLDDPLQQKIYDAETVKVAPGKQQAAGGGDNRENVAGAGRSVTGAEPHDRPDHVPQADAGRFKGDTGIFSSMGAGSAAPWDGSSAVKEVAQLFPDPAEALQVEDRTHSSTEAMLHTWVKSVGAAWRNFGTASAKPPTGREIKDSQQLLVREDPSGHTHIQGQTANTMLPADQQPELKPVSDPQLYKDKAARAGQAIHDAVVGAEDPSSSVAHQTGDGRRDGMEHFMSRSAEDAADKVSQLPAKAGGALVTAAEMVEGVAGHLVDSTKQTLTNLKEHRDTRNLDDVEAKMQRSVENVTQHYEAVNAGAHNQDMHQQQLHRMADAGVVSERNETLGDKVLHPLTKQHNDPTRAIELAKSYMAYKEEKEGAAAAGEGEGYDPLAHMEANKEADAAKFPKRDQVKRAGDVSNPTINLASQDYSGGEPGSHVHATKEPNYAAVKDELRAGDEEHNKGSISATRHIFGLSNPEGSHQAGGSSSSGGGAHSGAQHGQDETLLQKLGHVLGLGKEKAADAADEAKASAAASKDVVVDTARDAADNVKDSAANAKQRASDAAADTKQGAAEAKDRAADALKSARDQTSSATGDAKARAKQGVHDAGDKSKGLLEAATEKLGELVGRVKGGAEQAGEKAVEGGEAAAAKVGEAAGNVGSSWEVAGEKLSEKVGQAQAKVEERGQQGKDSAAGVADAARDSSRQAAEDTRRGTKGVTDSVKEGWHQGVYDADKAADSAAYKTGEVAGQAAEAGHRTAEAAGQKVQDAKEEMTAAADAAGDVAGYTADATAKAVGSAAGSVARVADRAADSVKGAAGATAEGVGYGAGATAEAGAAVGGGLLETVKGLVTGLLGPMEKEGAFEESAAVVVPAGEVAPDAEPKGVEQPAHRPTTTTTSSSTGPATTTTSTSSSTTTKPGGSQAAAEGWGAAAPAGDEVHGNKWVKQEAEAAKTRLQAIADDAAKAVGLAAGNTADAAKAAGDAVQVAKDKMADAQWQMDSGDAPDIPAEPYTNTEDLIKMRQQVAEQEAQRGTAYRTSR